MSNIVIETVIPCVVFGSIALDHVRNIYKGTYSINLKDPHNALAYFASMRHGWVEQNHLIGQAACNTTRDYFRVVIFLAGNAILCSSILVGFALRLRPNENMEDLLMFIKLFSCVCLLLTIFILLLICNRYMLQFR
jgi:hypothetical protein